MRETNQVFEASGRETPSESWDSMWGRIFRVLLESKHKFLELDHTDREGFGALLPYFGFSGVFGKGPPLIEKDTSEWNGPLSLLSNLAAEPTVLFERLFTVFQAERLSLLALPRAKA